MARVLIKSVLASALHYSGVDQLMSRTVREQTPLILGYHRVVEDFATSSRRTMPSMLVSAATLERHIDWVARSHAFIGLDEAAERVRAGSRGRPAAVITFDDGYRDVYEIALPLLKRKGVPCAVFVVSGLAGTRSLLLHDQIYLAVSRCLERWGDDRFCQLDGVLRDSGIGAEIATGIAAVATSAYNATRAILTRLDSDSARLVLEHLRAHANIGDGEIDEMAMMNWDEIAAVRRAGNVVGSHTRTHAFLTNEPAPVVTSELRESRRELELHLGGEVRHLAYPNGDFNATVASAARDAGYRYAYTVCSCRQDATPEFTIPRRMVWERSGFGLGDRFSPQVFDSEMLGVFDQLSGCERVHREPSTEIASLTRARTALFGRPRA